jgi:hypothetical protein
MDGSLTLQYAIIGLLVLVSVWVVLKKQFPGTLRKARVALALPLLREGRPGWLRALGRWIAPLGSHVVGGGAAGKDCGGCDGCN